jgi:hypothetical protein
LGQSIYNSFENINNAYNSTLYNSALTDQYRTGQTLSNVGNVLGQVGSLAGSALLPGVGGMVGQFIGVPFQAIGAAEAQSALYQSNVAGVNPGSLESALYRPIIGGYNEQIQTTAALNSIPIINTIANFFGANEYNAPSVNVVPSQYGDTYYGLAESGTTLNTSFTSNTGANVLALAQANGLNVMINGDNVQIDITGASQDQLASFYTDLNNAYEQTMTLPSLEISSIFDPLNPFPTLEGAEQIEISADEDSPYVINEKGEIVRNPNYKGDEDGGGDGSGDGDGSGSGSGSGAGAGNVPDDAEDSGEEDSADLDLSLPPAQPGTPGAQAQASGPTSPAPSRPTTPSQETGAYRGNTIGGGRGLRR